MSTSSCTAPRARLATGSGRATGDTVGLVGPDQAFDGVHGGVEFPPAGGTRTLLLAGDETAVLDIAGILERLPADSGDAVLEVPTAADVLDLAAHGTAEADVGAARKERGTARDRGRQSRRLPPVSASTTCPAHSARPGSTTDEELWDVPDPEHPGARTGDGRYA